MAFIARTLLLFAGIVFIAGADNWDRFRGPNGAGTVDDKGIPVKFGTQENVIWKVALPGTGIASPVVWGNRLFLHSASKDGKSRTLLCLDTADGKILWQRSIPGVHVTIRPDSSLASSTPTTDGQMVYVSFWDGRDILLSAYDFQGKKLWSKNLGPFNSQHGAAASPIVYKDKLFLANDMDREDFTTKKPNARPSMLIALDKRTGDLIWETPREAERACYSAPFLLHKLGQSEPELVVTSTTAVTSYNLKSGSKVWEARNWQENGVKSPLRTIASPVLLGDVLCICSGGDAGRFAIGLALPDAGKKDAPQRLWDNRKDFPYVASPLAHGEHFYFVNDAGFAGCYHARTGKRLWFERLSDSGFHSSPLLIGGKVYAPNAAGDVYVFAAEPTYRLLARNELGEVIRATAAVGGGRLFIRGERHLYCIGLSGAVAPAPRQAQTIDTKADFRGLCVASPKVIWVSGTKGTYVRTTDGGKNWSVGTVPGAEKLDFRDVEAFGEDTAYLLSAGPGDASRIYKTADGGKSWTMQFKSADPADFLDAIAFWDEKNGVALGDPVKGVFQLLATTDGGANWEPLATKNLPAALPGEGAFAASGTCLVTHGESDVWFATGSAKTARVFHSIDRGRNWEVSETPIAAGAESAGIFSIAFRDKLHGMIVGGDYRKPNDIGATVATTSDGGKTWKLLDKQLPFRSAVAWAKDRWVAVGTSGSHVLLDNGDTWKLLDGENYNSVGFTSTGECWAVGPKGRIAKFGK